MSRPQRIAWAVLALATLGQGLITFVVWPRLFGSTPAGVASLVAARCEGPRGAPCAVKTLVISPGRYWLEASDTQADRVRLDFALPLSGEPVRALLLGAGAAGLTPAVEHAGTSSSWEPVATEERGGGSRRRVLLLSGLAGGDRVRVTLVRQAGAAEPAEPLRVEEIGLFASEAGLLADARGFLKGVPDRQLYNGLLARACVWLALLGTAAALLVPHSRGAAWARAMFVFFVALAATSLELWVLHNPYWNLARDLRVILASGPVQEGIGANLNYGMHLGSRLLLGEGLTFGPGWVPWERMPGYGFFCALAGLLAGYKTDIFSIGVASIELHLLFLALACAAFTAAATRVMRPGLAVAAAVVVIFMPNQLANTQADSIMVAVYLLTAATLVLFLDRERAGPPVPLRFHLMAHLAFALWFLMRPEGVVAWAALSLVLYWRTPRYLALPALLYLAIGLSWGLYKRQYTGEFSMTTNTIGDNAWISLWQAPSKFRWQTQDASYFEFEKHLQSPPRSKRASDEAFQEVARFAATYPVYVAHVALFKFVRYLDVDVFNGIVEFPHLDYRLVRGLAAWSLLGVVALALVLPWEGRRALFLGWPILFNLPLFLFFFSDGMRHVAPVSASLLVTAGVTLGEAGFYRALLTRRRRALAVAAIFVVSWPLLHWADQALLASDRLRYWTPFLDPAPFQWYLR